MEWTRTKTPRPHSTPSHSTWITLEDNTVWWIIRLSTIWRMMDWVSQATSTIEWSTLCKNRIALVSHLSITWISISRIWWVIQIQEIWTMLDLQINLVIHNSIINSYLMPQETGKIKPHMVIGVVQVIQAHRQATWDKEPLQLIRSIIRWWTNITRWITTKCHT